MLGRILRGYEVGNLMDFKQATYTRGSANWQQAFLVVYVDRSRVSPNLTYFEKDGSFIFEGKRYG